MMPPQDFLNQEFQRRKGRNLQYSQRAYARDLNLSAPFLSQLMSGKKKLSPDRGSELLKKMDWPKSQKDLFLKSVRFENAKNSEHKNMIEAEIKNQKSFLQYQDLKLDTIQVISNWYYHAFLALLKTKNFKSDDEWISKRLGLSVEKVQSIISVLGHLGFIQHQAGRWVAQYNMLRGKSVPSRALRDHHRQFLDLAKSALEQQSPEERDITGSTLAIDISKLPEAKKLIREFREQMSELLCDSEKSDDVYRLSVQLFRVGEKD